MGRINLEIGVCGFVLWICVGWNGWYSFYVVKDYWEIKFKIWVGYVVFGEYFIIYLCYGLVFGEMIFCYIINCCWVK